MVVANIGADRSERYRKNKVISHLLDMATAGKKYDLTDLWNEAEKFKTEDMEEFYTLIGYSFQGFQEVFGRDYVDPVKAELSLLRAFHKHMIKDIDNARQMLVDTLDPSKMSGTEREIYWVAIDTLGNYLDKSQWEIDAKNAVEESKKESPNNDHIE